MYGFWRLGLRPAPSAGATWVANGLETATSMKAKNVVTRPSTGTTHARRSGPVRRANATAAAEKPVSTSSQRRSEPSCPPQKAEIVYGVGSSQARVLGDVDEREVVAQERREQDARGNRRRAERGEERVLRRARQAPAPGERPRSAARRERRAPEPRQRTSAARPSSGMT